MPFGGNICEIGFMDEIKLTVLLRFDPDSNLWIAKGLEYDFAMQGSSEEQALNGLMDMLKAKQEFAKENGMELRDCTPQAHTMWWDMAENHQNTRVLTIQR